MAPVVAPERQFPLLVGEDVRFRSIPWGLIAPHEKRARNNHGQSLEILARRGGLSIDEALAVIEDMDIPRRRDAQAAVLLWAHVEKYRRVAAIMVRLPEPARSRGVENIGR